MDEDAGCAVGLPAQFCCCHVGCQRRFALRQLEAASSSPPVDEELESTRAAPGPLWIAPSQVHV